jgi:hypothetical protein
MNPSREERIRNITPRRAIAIADQAREDLNQLSMSGDEVALARIVLEARRPRSQGDALRVLGEWQARKSVTRKMDNKGLTEGMRNYLANQKAPVE